MFETIIGMSGKAGSGKNTSADILQAHLEKTGYIVTQVSFAGPLKEIATTYFGGICDPVKKDPVSRAVLQGVGTLMCGEVDNNYWVNKALDVISQDYRSGKRINNIYIVTDMRFVNEAERLRQYAAQQSGDLHLIRLDNRTLLDGENAKHVSETALDDYDKFDLRYDNTGTLADLEDVLIQYANDYIINR